MNLLKLITPTNLGEERERFFADEKYHPVFWYSWQNKETSLPFDNIKTPLIRAILGQDHLEIMRHARVYFEVGNWDLLEVAKLTTSKIPVLEHRPQIEEFVKGFEEAFETLGLSEYSVDVVDGAGFNCRPQYKLKQIHLSKHADFQFFDVEGEVRHELTHIIRHENGNYNKIKKSPNYLPTEEGLATLMHDSGNNGHISEFQHAAEYIASTVGEKGSLRDIYNYFVEVGFNNELAWQRASRHKFGFVDTRAGGDILKPAMYFAHSQKLKKLATKDLIRLFVGKIELSELEGYKKYEGIIDKEIVKDFYKLGEV